MNNSAQISIGVVVGGLVGAAVSHLITKSLLTKRHELEIQDMKDNFRPLPVNHEGKPLFFDPHGDAEANYKKAKDIVRTWELIQDNGYGITDPFNEEPPAEPVRGKLRVPQSDAVRKAQAIEEEEEVELDDGIMPAPKGNIWDNEIELSGYLKIDNEPYLITRAEFEEVEPQFDTVSLTWYLRDTTLSEDLVENGNAEIDDIDWTIGSRHLEMFGKASGDKDVFFIKNEQNGSKYEVTRVDAYYQEVVLGLAPDDIQGYQR